jgi:UDP-2,4-diacetamido-2,4,6-trideoxy-beta-L-altropyranose hydrolase
MPELMVWSDLAITAAGSTCWELAFMGLPSIFVILAENQVEIALQLAAEGFGICLGNGVGLKNYKLAEAISALARDKSFLKIVSKVGRGLVDGDGTATICKILK